MNNMEKLFDGQVAIISGGMGDIGFATAIALAKQGAHVALCGVRPLTAVAGKVDEILKLGVKCTYHEVDVADASAVNRWIEVVTETLGVPRLIIANAAVTTLAGIHQVTPDDWKRNLDVNLNGAFYLTQATTALLLKGGLSGRVVFVGSWAGANVHTHMPAYSVSKAGMTMLCKCMALELAPHRILVNEVAPGYVAAGLTGKIWQDDPKTEDIARECIPIGEVIFAEEVADQIVYLCGPDSRHMTGSTLLMDGGLSLK